MEQKRMAPTLLIISQAHLLPCRKARRYVLDFVTMFKPRQVVAASSPAC